jgi:hypothetical protein
MDAFMKIPESGFFHIKNDAAESEILIYIPIDNHAAGTWTYIMRTASPCW